MSHSTTPLTALNRSGFDTRSAGTNDQAWRSLLVSSPLLHESLGSTLIVAPHPDDETFAAAGLQQHFDAEIVVVTDGEAARPEDANLAARRRREVRSALLCLGQRAAAPTFLGLPDGHVSAREQQLERLLAARLAGISTLIAPYEFDGHPDHDAVGRVCLRLARRHGVRLLRYFIWAWHRLVPADFRAPQFVRLALTDSERRRKQRAMQCFHSQLDGGVDAIVPPHVLIYFSRPYEAFLQ
jgi:LmbE family N-acetylglucosaminyl deacetylase